MPPKKLFGNQSDAFVRKRQGELAIYLQTVLHHLTAIPAALANFLDFHKYVSTCIATVGGPLRYPNMQLITVDFTDSSREDRWIFWGDISLVHE